MVIDRPQDPYIRILYKINEGYTSFQIEQDLIKTIGFYSNKSTFTDEELKELERACKSEWSKAILLFEKLKSSYEIEATPIHNNRKIYMFKKLLFRTLKKVRT